MSDRPEPEISHKIIPVEEGKSITGSGAVADDPQGPNFTPGPTLSTGTPPASDDD